MMDGNRIPKMLYKIYAANWFPYSVRPVVYLAHHWNRSGGITVNAFSNCPSVRLLINGVKQGNDQIPYPDSGSGTALLAHQCSWNVTWQSGTVTAQGLDASGNVVCSDEKKTAGSPDHILLTVAAPIVNPATGDTFRITANGSDAAFILATIVDAQGNWCPTASNIVHFTVSGPGNYRGGADQMIGGGGANYHSPGDPELTAEGGMCKVAIRSTFTTGTVTVTATSGALTGTTSFTVYPVPTPPPVSVRGPVNPASLMPAPSLRIGMAAGSLRYFISQSANVALEILTASGRTVCRVPNTRQAGGWHSVPFNAGGMKNNSGVYMVRCTVNGQDKYVKRVMVMR